MQPSRNISRLVEIMAALRDPATGCPWDVEQTFETIVPYTVEEVYEVVDAIERRDPEDLREELGDLLLQVVYYAQLAEEARLFSFGDVVETVTRKMIRRHPHVFGDTEARSARSAKGQWDRIKAEEKAERLSARLRLHADTTTETDWAPKPEASGHLDVVPGTFPALMLAMKIQERAAKVGFDWSEAAPILAKLKEETAEFEAALDSRDASALEDELGDLLFCVVNLARHARVDPDRALRGTVTKFRSRFAHIEAALTERGLELQSASLSEMEALWQEAKGRNASVASGRKAEA